MTGTTIQPGRTQETEQPFDPATLIQMLGELGIV